MLIVACSGESQKQARPAIDAEASPGMRVGARALHPAKTARLDQDEI
jgi:hypothetical protein